MRLLVFVFIIFICNSCVQKLNYQTIKLDGIVSYTFSKKGSSYWLRRVDYESIDGELMARLKPDYFYIETIDKMCPDIVDIKELKNLNTSDFKKQTLHYSPNFRNQSFRSHNPIHYGGDIYFFNDSTLVVAFLVEGQGLLFSEICESFKSNTNEVDEVSSIPCEYLEDKIELPFAVLVRYDTTYSLNSKQISDLGLQESQLESFSILWCE